MDQLSYVNSIFATATDISAPEAHARSLSPNEAQGLCNFVIHMPKSYHIKEIAAARSCRPEAVPGRKESHASFATTWTNANPSSYRTEYRSTSGAHFRIKQFLFDWAPPFAGQPNLWNHESHGLPLTAGAIVWIGTDYKECQGACSILRSTIIELSVIDGKLADDEIFDFYNSLAPVDEEYAALHLDLRLHEVGYWQRFRPKWLKVPFSLWRPSPFNHFAMDDWRTPTEETLRLLVGNRFVTKISGYEPETIGFLKLGTSAEAFDYKLRHQVDPTQGLRLYHRNIDCEENREATLTQEFSIAEKVFEDDSYRVDIAFISEKYGPFEFKVNNKIHKTETIAMFSSCLAHKKNDCSAIIISTFCNPER